MSIYVDKNSVHLFYGTLLNFVNMTNNKETCSNYVAVFSICNTVCAQVRVIELQGAYRDRLVSQCSYCTISLQVFIT